MNFNAFLGFLNPDTDNQVSNFYGYSADNP